jgi:hypothetical protein
VRPAETLRGGMGSPLVSGYLVGQERPRDVRPGGANRDHTALCALLRPRRRPNATIPAGTDQAELGHDDPTERVTYSALADAVRPGAVLRVFFLRVRAVGDC